MLIRFEVNGFNLNYVWAEIGCSGTVSSIEATETESWK